MDYTKLPTPPACVADFCLIPVRIYPSPQLSSQRDVGCLQDENLIGFRLGHLLLRYQMKLLPFSDWWKHLAWAIPCTRRGRQLVWRPFPEHFRRRSSRIEIPEFWNLAGTYALAWWISFTFYLSNGRCGARNFRGQITCTISFFLDMQKTAVLCTFRFESYSLLLIWTYRGFVGWCHAHHRPSPHACPPERRSPSTNRHPRRHKVSSPQ
jgi:hypothetical protein